MSICVPLGTSTSEKLPAASELAVTLPMVVRTPAIGRPSAKVNRPTTAVRPPGVTSSITVAVRVWAPRSVWARAVTVSGNDPDEAPALAVTVSVVDCPPVRTVAGEKAALIPAGTPPIDSDARPVNGAAPVLRRVTAYVLLEPCRTEATPGKACTAKSCVLKMENGRLPVPLAAVTVTGPVEAPDGTVVTRLVAVRERTTAATPLKATTVGPGEKPAPVMVAKVPIGPREGSTAATTTPRTTAKARWAGVGSSLPARSRLFTSKTCGPSVKPVNVAVLAVENAVNGQLSRGTAKTRSGADVKASVPVKAKVAVVSRTAP